MILILINDKDAHLLFISTWYTNKFNQKFSPWNIKLRNSVISKLQTYTISIRFNLYLLRKENPLSTTLYSTSKRITRVPQVQRDPYVNFMYFHRFRIICNLDWKLALLHLGPLSWLYIGLTCTSLPFPLEGKHTFFYLPKICNWILFSF